MDNPLTSTVRRAPDVRRVTPLEITVLAGGPGPEREVSLNSGAMVREALSRLGHRAVVRDISPDDLTALDAPADVVFVALHGVFGEDGELQRILDERGVVYTASGAEASALAMDKVHTKARLIEHGIPTPWFDVVKPARIEQAVRAFRFPVVVKPRDSGSSVDTYIVRDPEAFEIALRTVIERYGVALVERYVDGYELTVGILQGRALPVCEIRTEREFYDYQAKYLDDDTEYLFDLDLPNDLLRRVQIDSEKVHAALGCRDFSRVDWMVDRETLDPFVIELNTIPGFTSHSLLPKAAARVGISYDALCQRIVQAAMGRADPQAQPD